MKPQKSLKIVIAPDSFKGSISAQDACDFIERGLILGSDGIELETVKLPIADGGEGTLCALTKESERISATVTATNGQKITAQYGFIENTAVIEMARAAGLTLTPENERRAETATTYGVGELILDALNKGFKKARGEWLFWLNADDVLLAGALKSLELKVKSLEFKDVEWIAGDMVLIDGEGKVIRCQKDRGSFRAYEGKPIRVFGPSSFFRRELFERIGGFDVNLRYCMDTDLWCRFREAGAWFKKTGSYVWGFR